MKGRSFGLLLTAAGSTVLALVAGEVLLRLAAPVPDPYADAKARRVVNQYIRSEFPPNLQLRTEAEPGLPGVTGTNRFSTNNLGFRGDSLVRPKPEHEYRVFVLGGSSAECLYLDDTAAVTAVLQDELQRRVPASLTVRVYGAAKSGDRSDDHVSMLVHRVLHLEPDLIVVFAGINDLSSAIYGLDELHRVARTPGGAGVTDTLGFTALARLAATQFQIPRRLYYLAKRIQPVPDTVLLQEIPLRSDYRSLVEKRQATPPTGEAPRVAQDLFRTNLRTLVSATRASGAGIVLMTQQTTWASAEDPGVDEWQWMLHRNGKTYDAGQMNRALDQLNDVTRDVAREADVPVYDLSRALPKTREYFYDDVHFNTRGAQRAAQDLASVIAAAGFPGMSATR